MTRHSSISAGQSHLRWWTFRVHYRIQVPGRMQHTALTVIMMRWLTSPSCVDVELGQRQGEGQLSPLGVGGTLQDVMQSVSASRPARGDEICVRGLNIRHRSCIAHTATPTRETTAVCPVKVQASTPHCAYWSSCCNITVEWSCPHMTSY